MFLRSVLFEEFGLRYIGPINGHNMHALLDAFSIAKDYDRSIVLHVSTRKGKGYSFAEAHPEVWHGTSSFDVATGELLEKKGSPGYSIVFGTTLQRLAEKDDRIVAITAAMCAGTGLTEFAARFPERFFDVGICEEHAVVFAAGLATENMRPVFAVYSTFSQRAVDCVIHDVCLQNLPVVICLDRAGIVGEDGPTHHGVFDIALFRPVPNLVFVQPKDEAELANMLFSAVKWGRPVVIRYPRGSGPGVPIPDEFTELEIGKAEVILGDQPGEKNIQPSGSAEDEHRTSNIEHRSSNEEESQFSQSKIENRKSKMPMVWLWALGDMVPLAVEAAGLLAERKIAAGVVNARFIRPMDEQLLRQQSAAARVIAVIENGVVTGGFGSGVGEFLMDIRWPGTVLRFGWPDQFIPHGGTEQLMEQFGLTAEAVAKRVADVITQA